MKLQDFKLILDRNSYSYIEKDGKLIIRHHGSVYLTSLTTLPDGIKFENHGSVYLTSLKGSHFYMGMKREFQTIDGVTTIIGYQKKSGEMTIKKGLIFGGGELSKLDKTFIVSKGKFNAHGKSLREAIDDCNFKFLQESQDASQLIVSIKKSGRLTKNDYRLLTGACKQGTESFLSSEGIEVDYLPISEVIELTKNQYGGDRFSQLMGEY